MTWRDYMKENPSENIWWCAPYKNKEGDITVVERDGFADAIIYDGKTVIENDGGAFNASKLEESSEFADLARKLAGDKYDEYDLYENVTNKEIAHEYLHEVGCAHCPFFAECEEMDEVFADDDEEPAEDDEEPADDDQTDGGFEVYPK